MQIKIQLTNDNGKVFEGVIDLKEVFRKGAKSKISVEKVAKGGKLKVMPSHIISEELYKKHFFKSGKGLTEVAKQLDVLGYHFKKGSILMALKGLSVLMRTGKKGAYRFIQRQPFKG